MAEEVGIDVWHLDYLVYAWALLRILNTNHSHKFYHQRGVNLTGLLYKILEDILLEGLDAVAERQRRRQQRHLQEDHTEGQNIIGFLGLGVSDPVDDFADGGGGVVFSELF